MDHMIDQNNDDNAREMQILKRVSEEIRVAHDLLRKTEAIVIENSENISGPLLVGIQHFDRISQFMADLEKFVIQLSEMTHIHFVMPTEVETQWKRLSNVENWVTCKTSNDEAEHVELF